MSLEAHKVLSEAREILHLSPLHPSLVRLFPEAEVRSLHYLYEHDLPPVQLYERAAQLVLNSALESRERGATTCLAVYGHPLWFVKPTRIAMSLADAAGLPWRLVVGYSSFDTLLRDSPVELDWGAQLLDATRFVAGKADADPRVPLVLFQVGILGARSFRDSEDPHGRFEALKTRLNEKYPADHKLYIVMSGWGGELPTQVTTTSVQHIAEDAHLAHGSTTLVIPPVQI